MGIKKFITNLVDWAKNHPSDLKMGFGTGGVIGGTVLLCKESVAASKIIAEYKDAKQKLINEGAEKKDIRKLTAKTIGKVTATVLPGASVEGAGLGLMWSGYSNMKAAFVGVGIAYGELQEFINKYRAGVREEYGEEVDEKFAYQFREEEVVIQDENGTERTETVRVYPNNSRNMPSPYARYFCYGEAEGAERSFDYNDSFLRCKESAMNACFRARKKFMLNDVYDELGYKRSKAGNRVGWVYDPDNPEGDNKIDLRIKVVYREKLDEYGNPNGYERVHMIDPNVDGMVEDKMIRLGLIDE